MSLLRKLPNKPPNPQSILKPIFTRFFTTQNPNRNTFPDEPTSAYYDDLISDAGRSGDLETVRHLLNKRMKDGCFNTTNTFKFITNTDTSLSILEDLYQIIARLDRGFPRKSACDTLIARLCKLHRIDESLRVVDAMASGEYGLTVATFYPILSALTRMKKMEDAWCVMELMRSVGVPPDLTAYNYFLTSYCVGGNLTKANEVLRKMEEEGLGADSRTYDALVLGACRAGKVEGAMVVLRRMVDDGVPVMYSTHSHVISGLMKLGYYAQAVKFVIGHGGRDKKLDTESFGALASRLIKFKRIEEAKLLLEEMGKRGLAMGDNLRDFYKMNVKSQR